MATALTAVTASIRCNASCAPMRCQLIKVCSAGADFLRNLTAARPFAVCAIALLRRCTSATSGLKSGINLSPFCAEADKPTIHRSSLRTPQPAFKKYDIAVDRFRIHFLVARTS